MASKIAAIVLAAGQSRRMGSPKMVLPWGKTTVIGQVVCTLASAEVDEIVVVTGGAHRLVEASLEQLACECRVRSVFNPDYASGEMLSSLQAGLRSMGADIRAVLIALGDQPEIQTSVVADLIELYARGAQLVVPSYKMRRGHPWLVDRRLWVDLFELQSPQTLRHFLNSRADEISYLEVDTDSVLSDLDTPEDYHRSHPS